MELSDLWRAVRRHWIVAAVVFAATMAVAVAAAYVPAQRYRSTATVLFQPNANQTALGGVQVVQFLMPSIAPRVKSRSFEAAALKSVSTAYTESGGLSLDVKGDPATGIATITAESANRDAVAPVADALADALVSSRLGQGFLTMTIIDRALPPTSASAPVRPPILLAGLVLGLILAITAAAVASSLSARLNRPEEIRRRFGTSVLGEIPRLSRKRSDLLRRPHNLFGSDAGADVIVDALHTLRANMEITLQMRDAHALTVTSARLGEGKSTVAANLGWLLASLGRKVTLVDADLRRPTLHTFFDMPFGEGLADATTVNVSRIRRATTQPNLSFVPAGFPVRHPAEVVSAALPRVLEATAGAERVVVVDAPPVGSMAETTMVAAMTGHVVLVIDARKTDFGDIEWALGELRDRGVDVLGVVLNRVPRSRLRVRSSQYYSTNRDRNGAAKTGRNGSSRKTAESPTVVKGQVSGRR